MSVQRGQREVKIQEYGGSKDIIDEGHSPSLKRKESIGRDAGGLHS